MRDGYLRGALSRPATPRQQNVLAAYVAAGGSVPDAAEFVGIRPSTVKRHRADLRARSGLTTEQLIYVGRAEGWLVVPSLEPQLNCPMPRAPRPAGRRVGLVNADLRWHEHDAQSLWQWVRLWATAKSRGASPSDPSGDGLSREAGT